MFLIVFLYALFASSILGSKILLHYTQPIFLTGIRMFLGGILLLSFQYFHPQQHFKFRMKHLKYYAQLVIFGIYITYILRFWALEHLPAFKTSFLYNLSPFLTSLYSYFFFQEKMTRKQWVGLGIGLLGLIPILLTSSKGEATMGEFVFISWPELAVIVSVAAHSYSWIVMRKLVRYKSYSPMMVNGISMTAGGLLALATSPFFEGFAPVTSFWPFAGALAFVILVSNIICHNLYGHLLKSYTATFLSFAGFLSPLFAAFYEWALYAQKISWHFYASSFIVLIGLFLFYQDELLQPRLIEEEE